MQESTKTAYRKLCSHFFTHYMKGKELTSQRIMGRLEELSPTFSIAYFRRLKNALAFDLTERGYSEAAQSILKLVNPVTAPGSPLRQKAKRPKAKYFSDEDYAVISAHLLDKQHHEEWAALTLIKFTGARPVELRNLTVKDGIIVILGAKKSHAGTRGADRLLAVEDPGSLSIIETCLMILNESGKTMDAIRHRLRDEGVKLWPRRSATPTLYSMRHQVGSNLKASGQDARAVAYIMGHQSTTSVSVYGDRRRGNPSAIKVLPAQDAQLDKVRDKVKPAGKRRFEAMVYRPNGGAPNH
ncbi:site-specific integrase [Halopseudomonas pelagia]|uniref:site-specific integrase n=1 Tax=Halopseudomonas pelagia TaxID=553151 RepID=UPI0003A66607|nr:site-specific integrase [Halopseudomonas pelagia]